MRHYIIGVKGIRINKENNEDYDSQINLFANADNLLKDNIITEEIYINFKNEIRDFIKTDKVIAIGKTEVENEFDIYIFDLVSDYKTIYNVKFDEELGNHYIETGDGDNGFN